MAEDLAELCSFFHVDERDLDRVLSAALDRGADFADVYFQHRATGGLGLEDGIVGRASTTVDRGVGIRAVVGDQTGYAYCEELDVASMIRAAETAASIAQSGERVQPQAFRRDPAADLYTIGEPWDGVGPERRMPLVVQADGAARSADPSVERVRVNFAAVDERILIATSDGALFGDRRPMTRLGLSVTTNKGGELRTNHGNVAGRRGIDWFTGERINALCRKVVDQALLAYEARRPPAGEMPVVLAAGASGILLHEAIGHGMEADFNRKGISIYASLMNEKVADSNVTIVDSGLHPNERGAINFDDEGGSSERTVLVDGGVMRSYLHDRISAQHFGVRSTGSGRRQSFRHVPMPRMRCTYMEPGPYSRDEIIASVDRGIVADQFLNGQVQIGAGDYTFYVKSGWLIENGRITAPIKDVNIIGNGPETLRRISQVGDDFKLDEGGWTCGKDGQSVPVSQGMPTVLVDRLTVGGEDA